MKTGVPGQKPLGAKERTSNKVNPHMVSTWESEPGPHWWEASAPHHCAIPCSPNVKGQNMVLTVYKGTDFPALMFPLAGVFLTW